MQIDTWNLSVAAWHYLSCIFKLFSKINLKNHVELLHNAFLPPYFDTCSFVRRMYFRVTRFLQLSLFIIQLVMLIIEA